MYTLRQILTGLRDHQRAGEEINKLFAKHILQKVRLPIDIFNKDWDNLIILDGCRHDVLQESDFVEGKFNSVWSGGSNSREFLEHNVQRRRLDDVVWVTANPFVSSYSENIFKINNVWKTGWNKKLQTVLPETMKQEAQIASKKYSNKRLVIHFMQPHYPFIGSTGRNELPEHRTFTGVGIREDPENLGRDIWQHLADGTVSRELVWKAYRENLEVALPAVRNLIDELNGKSIVTSDHGNEFGGRSFPIPFRLYSHPRGYRTKNLVKVPWVEFDYSERKTIKSGQIGFSETEENDVISERLKHLGYTDTSV